MDVPMVWLLVDGRPGNRAQCLGVAEALGFPFEVKELRYSALAGLPNALLGATLAGLDGASRAALVAPWPDLVIAAGRRTAPVARAIGRRAGGRAFLAQIMDPGWAGADDFSLIARPRHDGIGGAANTAANTAANVLLVDGAPHRVTPEVLAGAADAWRGRVADLPAPRIAVMVGGSTRRRRFTAAMAADLGRTASAMATSAGGSLMIATSRRTDAEAHALGAEVTAPHRLWRWGDAEENPYLGYLGLADAVIVTGDSVSMCSEACATAAPVHIYAPPGLTSAKHARFHQQLYQAGYARPVDGGLAEWTHPPLNAARDVALEIRRRLGL